MPGCLGLTILENAGAGNAASLAFLPQYGAPSGSVRPGTFQGCSHRVVPRERMLFHPPLAFRVFFQGSGAGGALLSHRGVEMSDQLPLDLSLSFENHPIHGLFYRGQPAWVAQQIAAALEIHDAADALRRSSGIEKGVDYDVIARDELLETGFKPFSSHLRTAAIVYEFGLYALIFRSRKPVAIRFKQWVFREVLPRIRATGSYSLVPADFQFDSITRPQLDLIREAGRGNGYARAILEAKGLRRMEEGGGNGV